MDYKANTSLQFKKFLHQVVDVKYGLKSRLAGFQHASAGEEGKLSY